MCAPDFFGVDYVINPWMKDEIGKTDHARAVQQWGSLKRWLSQRAELLFVPPQKGLPDMVFTANAGAVLGKKVIVSRFHAPERSGEEPLFRRWFEQHGFEIVAWPDAVEFEGAGDALFDREQNILWMGHGFRTDRAAAGLLEQHFGRKVMPLRLVDPRFYHLDTCLCPLPGGYLMYYAAAFDADSLKIIEAQVHEEKRIAVEEDDALKFVCNAVDLDSHIYINGASTTLQDRLRSLGFAPITVPLGEFMKSGGSAKCLTLKLVEN